MPTISGYAYGEPIEAVDINQYFLRGSRNAIINGDMRVAQRGTSLTVADGAYGLDRWVALGSGTGGVGSSGQNVSMAQQGNSGSGSVNELLITATTNNLKFGIVQIIENKNLGDITSGTVTVSFKAEAQVNITDVRCAVLGWTSTADAVTRDVVSTSGLPWLASPPTLAADWSYLNTPENLNVGNTWGTYRVNANVTGNPSNLAVFIWVNSTTHTTGNGLLLTDVQLESGAIATPFERKTFQEQLADCQRYYWRTPPSQLDTLYFFGFAQTATLSFINIVLPVPLRIAPTSVAFAFQRVTDITSGSSTVSSLTVSNPSLVNVLNVLLFVAHASFGTTFQPRALGNQNNTGGFIQLVAEL